MIEIQRNGQNLHENQKIKPKFSSIAKVNTRKIILEVTREILIKIQKNGQNLHENQKIQSKFPSIAKVDTRES